MTTKSFTRRSFVAGAAAVPFALRAMAEPVAAGPRWVFLGTDLGKGIYRASWNAATGELGKVELAAPTDRPDFFALNPVWPILYTVNSVVGDLAGVSSYHVDAARGTLTLLHRFDSHGDGPCAVSVDATGRAAFVANYQGGSFAAYHLAPGGEMADAGGLDCKGNAACGPLGPVKARQEAPHLHCAVVSPKNDFVLVCDLGDDAIEVFPIAPSADAMLGTPVRVGVRAGSGPRHVAFHPNGKWVYCIHEVDCTIDLFDWNAGKLMWRAGSVISTLAKGVPVGINTACEIVVSDDGKFVYACTRFVNEITVYRVDAATGLLTEQQRLSCGGQIPRYFAFDPSRRWLVCTNQGTGVAGSGNVTVFAHDPATGKLSETPKTFAAETPMFVLWV
jgi:6-phosphogluconolactonase